MWRPAMFDDNVMILFIHHCTHSECNGLLRLNSRRTTFHVKLWRSWLWHNLLCMLHLGRGSVSMVGVNKNIWEKRKDNKKSDIYMRIFMWWELQMLSVCDLSTVDWPMKSGMNVKKKKIEQFECQGHFTQLFVVFYLVDHLKKRCVFYLQTHVFLFGKINTKR